LYRAYRVYAYQLAVAIDDAEQGVTHVVRGADLLESTPRQIYLQGLLGLPTPRYAHLPVAVGEHGVKLSKQTLAKPLAPSGFAKSVAHALRFLGHETPAGLESAGLETLWQWAHGNWRLERVPRIRARIVSEVD